MLSQSNFYTRSVLSNSVKREVLWNVSEPGDPYDIKRSMISKLPGDRRPFMGDHLDLVCLFQAAEIERLCEFLEDYKLKFREIERNNLDRHSYEIQIKELTEEINIYESLRTENGKLKEFIKKQGMEIENLNRFSRDNRGLDDSFKMLYEKSNERLTQLGVENQKLLELNEEYRMQVQNFNARLEAFQRAKNREVEELRLNYAQYSKESFENSLNAQRYQTEGELRRLELELKRLKEAYDHKINENTLLIKTNQNYAKQLASKDKGEATFILDDRNREIQTKLALAAAEIERANISLREIRSRYDESEIKRLELQRRVERYDFTIRESEEKLRIGNNQIARLNEVIRQLSGQNKKIGESQYIAMQYQSKIQELSRERQQVISRIQLQVNNSQRLREELEKVQLENSKYKLIERENIQLKAEVGDRENLKRRAIELQNTLALKNQQFERIITQIKNKDAELERRRSIADENQGLRVRVKEVQTRLTSKYEADIARLRAEYEQRIAYINQAKGNEYQYKAQTYERQGERLKELLKGKSDEAEKQRSRIYELEHVISRLELQTSSKIKNYESNFGQMRKETEELYLRARKLQETERKLYEMQSRIVQLEKEQERLVSIVKGREEELFGVRNKLREIQQNAQRNQAQFVRKTSNYEQTIPAIRSQNQELRKRINEFVGESGKKLNETVQEINRLNTALRGLELEKSHLDARLKQITIENDNLRQNLQKSQREGQELRSKLAESEARLINISNESAFNAKRIIGENESLKQQLNDYKVSIANYEAEVNKRFAGSQQNLTALGRENEELRRRVRDLEGEVDAGGKRFKIKLEELTQMENKLRNFGVDLENAKRMHLQYQQTIQNMRKEGENTRRKAAQTEVELKNRIVNYQVQIQNFGRSNQANFNRMRDERNQLERQCEALAKNQERLVANLNQVLPENEALRKRIQNYETSIAAYQGEVNKRINAYQQTIAGLAKEREDLIKRLQQDGSESNRLLQESDVKLRNAIQEIAQLNAMLKAKQEQVLRMEQRIVIQNQEIDTIRKQCSELEIRFTQTYEIEVTKRYNTYEQTVSDLKRRLAQGEARYSMTAQELERFKEVLQGRQIELQQSRRSLKEYEVSFNQTIDIESRSKNDLTRKLAQAENRALILAQQGERLNVSLKARTEEARRVPELQQRITFLQQESQKFQFSLRNLEAKIRELGLENEQLRRQVGETEINWAKRYESQVGQQVGKFQSTLTTVTRQRDQLVKRRGELQSKIALLSQEVARTNQQLQRAKAEIQQLKRNSQRRIEQSQSQASNWQSNYHAIAGEFQSAKKHLQDYQLNIRQLYAEFQRLQAIISDLKKERQILIEKNHALGEEITRLRVENQDLEGQTRDVRLRLTDQTSLQKRINQHMALMVVLFAEIESLRRRVSDKQREVQTVRRSSLSPNIV